MRFESLLIYSALSFKYNKYRRPENFGNKYTKSCMYRPDYVECVYNVRYNGG